MRHKEDYRLKKRGIYWYYKLPEEKTFHSTGKKRHDEASRFADEIATKHKSTMRRKLAEYCQPFYLWGRCPLIEHRLNENKSIGKPHVQHQRSLLERYILHDAIAKIQLNSLKRGHIEDFRSRLKKVTSDNNTNRILGVLKAILKEAYHREDIDRDPTAGIGKIRVEPKTSGVFTREELNQFFNKDNNYFVDGTLGLSAEGREKATERRRIAYLILAETGMRRGEVLALQWQDINWDGNYITIQRAWKGDELGPPKSGKLRIVPMTRKLKTGLYSYYCEILTAKPNDFVICWVDGTKISTKNFTLWFKRAVDKMGLDRAGRRLTPHSLRHSRVTYLKEKRVPQEVIQAIIGHSDEKVTKRYTHFGDQFLVDEINKLES